MVLSKKQSSPIVPKVNDSLLVYSAAKDASAVDVIYRRLRQFSQVALKYGLRLTIQCEDNGEETVRLTHICPHSKAVEAMEEITKLVRKYDLTKAPCTNEPVFTRHDRKIMRKMVSEQDYFAQTVFSRIRSTPKLLTGICERMTRWTRGQQQQQQQQQQTTLGPFASYNSSEKKEQQLLNLLDLLQTKLHTTRTLSHEQDAIIDWFSDKHKFLYVPTTQEITDAKCMFRDQFQIHGVIGSIHYLPYFAEGIGARFVMMAVMNKKIVCWKDSRNPDCMLEFHNHLQKLEWMRFSKVRFATSFSYKKEVGRTYPHYYRVPHQSDIRKENKIVIQWLQNNYHCLHFPMSPKYILVLLGLYSTAINTMDCLTASQAVFFQSCLRDVQREPSPSRHLHHILRKFADEKQVELKDNNNNNSY